MSRYGSVDRLPFHDGSPKAPHTYVVTISTANPHAAQRLREVFESTADVDLDNEDRAWETYVEIVEKDEHHPEFPMHIWSSAYEPDEVDD